MEQYDLASCETDFRRECCELKEVSQWSRVRIGGGAIWFYRVRDALPWSLLEIDAGLSLVLGRDA